MHGDRQTDGRASDLKCVLAVRCVATTYDRHPPSIQLARSVEAGEGVEEILLLLAVPEGRIEEPTKDQDQTFLVARCHSGAYRRIQHLSRHTPQLVDPTRCELRVG
jgi:hypothetical protein